MTTTRKSAVLGTGRRLDAATERALAGQVAAGGGRAARAREELILCNQGMVGRIAKRNMGRGVEFEDLYQEGQLGLIRAIDKIDEFLAGPWRFTTFAANWIREAILGYIADHRSLVRVPRNVQSRSRLRRLRGEPLSPGALERLGKSEFSVGSLGGREAMGLFSGEPDPSAAAEFRDDVDRVRSLMRLLPPRQQDVMRMRYPDDGSEPIPLRAIGVGMGLSENGVWDIEAAAKKKLHRLARARGMTD